VQGAEIATADQLKLTSFDFCDFSLSDDETCQATLRMFIELDVMNTFHVPYDVSAVDK
jgi:cGMP-specific 3',5'-cyclic phosphodiesterase